MKSHEASITRFTIRFVIIAVLLTLGTVAAFSQDSICQNNPQAPQCYVNQQQQLGQQPRTVQPNFTPNQIDQMVRDNSAEIQRQHDQMLHMCEVRADDAYQQCVNSGRSYCTRQQCF
jgi:hypothetical protein